MIHFRTSFVPGAVRVVLLTALASATLAGCAPLLLGGAVFGTGLLAADRRTTGIQVEDEAIELKAGSRVRNLATLGHVNITSYNRVVLITGEVPGAAQKIAVGAAVAAVENVRSIANELVVAPDSSIAARSGDAVLTSKVKASLVEAKDVQANAFKVVTERNVVYLMGRVTDRESRRSAEIASAVSGVRKVVRVYETVSEAELNDIAPQAAASAASR